MQIRNEPLKMIFCTYLVQFIAKSVKQRIAKYDYEDFTNRSATQRNTMKNNDNHAAT